MPELSKRVGEFTDSVIRRMTRVSLQYGAVNLSQGFPDFEPPKEILERLAQVTKEDFHQYATTWGSQNFRDAVAAKQKHFMGYDIDPNSEIVVTCGSTEAMMAAMLSVTNPGDKVIVFSPFYENYGADTFRLYEMGMGPLAESRPWNTRNVVGSMRFLQRLWRNVIDETTGEVRVTDGELDTKTLKLLNNTIADVTVEMEAMRPNTAIAKLIVLNNHLTSLDAVPRAAVEPLILMLSPIAPHICEELWSKLGHTESLAHADWPKADERYVGQDSVTAVVQIKGKVRAKLEVSPDIDPKELEKMALEAVADRLGGKEPRKVIVKAPKIVSIVPAE